MEPLAGNPSTAYLGLGSNLGDRPGNLARAVRLLDSAAGVKVENCSSIYETEPWGLLDQPRFLNCAIRITTTLAPGPLLALAKNIEQEMGRVTGPRYGPRSIDIDILLFEALVIDWKTPDLQIPHPRMPERAFVLVPLAEIAAEVIHPQTGATIYELADLVGGKEGVIYWGTLGNVIISGQNQSLPG